MVSLFIVDEGKFKDMNTKGRIIDVVDKIMETDSVKEYLSQNDDLTQVGLNSILFIKLVVAIETEFDIQFDDEDLDYKKFASLKSLCNYVEEKIQIMEN